MTDDENAYVQAVARLCAAELGDVPTEVRDMLRDEMCEAGAPLLDAMPLDDVRGLCRTGHLVGECLARLRDRAPWN